MQPADRGELRKRVLSAVGLKHIRSGLETVPPREDRQFLRYAAD